MKKISVPFEQFAELNLNRLNRHLKLHSDMMAHQLAGVTLSQGKQLLEYLAEHSTAVSAIKVAYHNTHPGAPIMAIPQGQALQLPVTCPDCEELIEYLFFDTIYKIDGVIELAFEETAVS